MTALYRHVTLGDCAISAGNAWLILAMGHFAILPINYLLHESVHSVSINFKQRVPYILKSMKAYLIQKLHNICTISWYTYSCHSYNDVCSTGRLLCWFYGTIFMGLLFQAFSIVLPTMDPRQQCIPQRKLIGIVFQHRYMKGIFSYPLGPSLFPS